MGRDKALLEIEGQPLWQRQLAILRDLSPEQLMLSGPPRAGCECEIVPDAVENAGPLGGVTAALHACRAPLLVVLAVDLPKMTWDFLRLLLAQCGQSRGVVPYSSHGYEPLAAVYPAACASLAGRALREGEFSMQRFAQHLLAQGYLQRRELLPNELPLFQNLNTPEDYEQSREREISRGR